MQACHRDQPPVPLAVLNEMLSNYLFVSLRLSSGSIEIDKITLPAVKANSNSAFVNMLMKMYVSTSSSFQHRRLRAIPPEKIQIRRHNLERERRLAREDLHVRGHARHCGQPICMSGRNKVGVENPTHWTTS